MSLGHEKLDVYRLAIAYVAWVYEKSANLDGVHRAARDQWLRASQSIPLNIAEGNGKTAEADRRRYFEIARGSALECAAIQDVLVVGKAVDEAESLNRKTELDRMAAMLSRLGGRGYQVREGTVTYGHCGAEVDPGPDSDSDLDEENPQPARGDGKPAASRDAGTRRNR
jgi:four helix bundle protein